MRPAHNARLYRRRWLFRSGLNGRRWLHEASACCGADGGGGGRGEGGEGGAARRACREHASIAAQLRREASRRQALQGLWAACACFADRYSSSYIKRRFAVPWG